MTSDPVTATGASDTTDETQPNRPEIAPADPPTDDDDRAADAAAEPEPQDES